ncbi:PP2C family protein-serine/threonine phosphatase [Dictyobacter formicarum]|uniref:PPM-type phosphatase domain-containing protein n=1 Tax=Dictyobacter formicarum TaxID=2778368 RepID=A0ABQ3VTY2_9CHLR|nr:hypothetical protein [Dictyobacter formicarum]GHO89420.1 hypothetical protein KSZ_74260 [Dictyobacter formicarum]
MVARLIEEGKLTPDDLYTHPQRNAFYLTLFQQSSIDVDISVCPLQYGDTLLLCSYGLWNVVRDPIIEDILNLYTPDDPLSAADVLLQKALDGGGPNNMSVIVVSMLQPQSPTQSSGLQVLAIPASLHIPQRFPEQ